MIFLISIIVPVFNSEQTISSCIESVLGQKTRSVFEIIVVDDASTDDSAKEIRKFSKKIVFLKNEKNRGPAFSRNLGAKKAKGEIVCFIDADCVAEKDWLSEMEKPFSDKNVSAVQGAYRTRQKSIVARFVQEEIEQRYEKMRRAKNLDWVGSYSAAYRKDIFLSLGGFDEGFPVASGEDPDLSFRVAKKGHKIVFNEKAIVFHTHPDTFAKYIRTKFWRAYYRVLLYRKHPDKTISDSYTPVVLKLRLAMVAFLMAGAILSLFVAPSLLNWFFIFELSFLAVSALPFSLKALQKNFLVGILSPVFLFLRDFAFVLGLAFGLFRQVFK